MQHTEKITETKLEQLYADNPTLDTFLPVLVNIKKDYNLSWNDIAIICNDYFGLDYSESTYRKRLAHRYNNCTDDADATLDTTSIELLTKIGREKVKLHDENVQVRAYIRKIAREETYKEIALEAVEKMSAKKQLTYSPIIKYEVQENEGILCLSDWHLGIECENAWNSYNEEVAKERIAKLRDEVIYKATRDRINTLHVLNLGDMIAGRIHLTIRLESRYDVITQIMKVSELLCELLNDLSNHFTVEYYSCTDNHSRLEPKKDCALDTESLARITDWYIKSRLPQIKVNENKFGEDIITFNCNGFNILGIHGNLDKPDQVIDSISRMTEDHYDLICMAHRHHFSCDEKNRTVVVANSSLMGTDTYAKNLRLSANPSQNLIIVSPDNVTDAIYRILL